jgi:uncharacterized RDD family membrane protein YckC
MENHEYAGFWIRLGAVLIDMVVIAIVFWVPLTLIYGSEYWDGSKFFHGFWDLLLSYILPFVATIWFWLRFFGTPGKMALRLKIVDANTGRRLSLGQSIGRYFAYFLSAIPLLLGYIWVGIDKRKQGWHDKLAGTVVIRDTQDEPVEFESST